MRASLKRCALRGAGGPKSDMGVVFCSEERSKGCKFGAPRVPAAGYNHFATGSFKPGQPLYGCEAGCSKDHKRYGHTLPLLFDYLPPNERDLSRADMSIHAKIIVRANAKTGRGWVLAGSANLSTPAWGSLSTPKYLDSGGEVVRLSLSSWELGVVLHDVDVGALARKQVIPWRHPLPPQARYSREDFPCRESARGFGAEQPVFHNDKRS